MSTLSKDRTEPANVGDSGAQSQPTSSQPGPSAVCLEVPLNVRGSKVTETVGDTPRTELFEQTRSIIVFESGGVLRMSTTVKTGQLLVLTNLKSLEDAICRVVKVRAQSNSASYVEVEFAQRRPRYWGVYFGSGGIQTAESTATSAANVTKLAGDQPVSIPLDLQGIESASRPATAANPPTQVRSVAPDQIRPVPLVRSDLAKAQELDQGSSAGDRTIAESPPRTPPTETKRSSNSRIRQRSKQLASVAGSNWILIAVCGVPLLVVLASGSVLSKHKRGATQLAPIQLVTPAPVRQPIETPSAAAAATSSAAELTAGVHDTQAVTPVDANPVAPAPARGHSVKSTVPSAFGALNAHPVRTTHITPVTPPNLDSAVVPPNSENALLGITASTSSIEAPAAVISGNAPIPVGGPVEEPRVLVQVSPQYPSVAWQTRTEGDVVVAIVIDKSGSVSDVKTISGPPLLREAAVDAVRRWKYERTMLNGQPIVVQMLVAVRFRL